MKKERKKKDDMDEKIAEINARNEREKEKKLLNLLAEIIVSATLKELYETSD